MKDFYENTYYDLFKMPPNDLIKIAQEYNVTDYAYKDDCIDVDILIHSVINHTKTLKNILDYIKNEFGKELISLNLNYGKLYFTIRTEFYNFKLNIRKDNIGDDLLIEVNFKSERPDEYRDDRDRSKKISGVCTIIAKDITYGNDDEELEYEVDYDKIYSFITEIIDNPERFI